MNSEIMARARGAKVGRPGLQIEMRLLHFRPGRDGQKPFLIQQPGKSHRTDSERAGPQQFSATDNPME
jgi:hypothetical protein